MKIFGNGWLGNILREYFGAEIVSADIRSFSGEKIGGKVWINTAARTDIDWCEKNKPDCQQVNVKGAVNVAREAKKLGIKHVFISSGCIFESYGPLDWKDENAKPNPGCFYAKTKVDAEKQIMKVNPDSLIIRIRLPLHSRPHPRNTITKLLTYPQINNNQETVTIIDDILEPLKKLIDEDARGIYHLVNEGTISPAGIAMTFGHRFQVTSKREQDKRLEQAGRAHRVTTLLKSTKIPPLPPVRERLLEISKIYDSFLSNDSR